MINNCPYTYLVTSDEYDPFLTNYFEAENNFNPEINMIVYNLRTCKYTKDGVNWIEILEDHL
jgi:hypothetical protein